MSKLDNDTAINIDMEISRAQMLAADWVLDAHHSSNPVDCHFFYLFNYRTRDVRVHSIVQKDFDSMRLGNFDMNVLAHLLVELSGRQAKGGMSDHDISKLGATLIQYSKSTKTYRAWLASRTPDERMHMMINIYPCRDNPAEGYVRPVIIRPDGIVLTANEAISHSKTVRQIDKNAHPEWF